jgi:hypothetical protein
MPVAALWRTYYEGATLDQPDRAEQADSWFFLGLCSLARAAEFDKLEGNFEDNQDFDAFITVEDNRKAEVPSEPKLLKGTMQPQGRAIESFPAENREYRIKISEVFRCSRRIQEGRGLR